MAHVSEFKKQVVKRLDDLFMHYDIVGAVNMENLPAAQLQQMRAQLRGKVELLMTKRRLMRVAIAEVKSKKKGIEELEPHLKGMPALIFTKENPFSLFKTLKKSKSSAPAKEGQIAPKDIEVKAGPTSFAPGPIIGELGSVGIKCGVEGGKVAIKQDSIVVKEGQVIKRKQAEILTRLGIEPMEVGLNITAVYERGVIYTKDILDIDENEFNRKLSTAAREAFNLSVFAAYPTKDNVELLIANAFNDAKALGIEQNIIDEGIIDALLGKAESSMLSLKSIANIEVPEKPVKREAKIEEKPMASKHKETVEEKKEEVVLEKEKEIIKEEKELEKIEPVIAPLEKEIKKAFKEEEEKQLEKERIETEKEFEEIKHPKKHETTEEKVAGMVSKLKIHAEGKEPTAEKIIKEISEEPKRPSSHDLANKKKDDEHKMAEKLAKELLRKGTLRK